MDGGAGGFARATLSPGGTLCDEVTAGGRAVVHAFRHGDDLEGCARLIPAGEADRLMTFPAVDACRWATHGTAPAGEG